MPPSSRDAEEPYEPEDRHFLEEDEYEAFLRRELGGDGTPRGSPPIGLLIAALVVVLLIVALLMAR